jgi:hypothetical protein
MGGRRRPFLKGVLGGAANAPKGHPPLTHPWKVYRGPVDGEAVERP